MKRRILNLTQRKFPPISARKRNSAVFNRSKLNRPKLISVFGITAAVCVSLVLLTLMLFPSFLPSSASAESGVLPASANLSSSSSLSADNGIINVTPSAAAGQGFGTGTVTLTIGSASTDGYTLTMNAVDGTSLAYQGAGAAASGATTSGTAASGTGTSGTVADIPSITDTNGLTGTQMSTDGTTSSWGYTLSAVHNAENNADDLANVSFLPITTDTVTVADTTDNSTTEHKIGFGVHAAGNATPGKYSRNIMFTLTSKSVPAPEATTMQEWTGCDNLTVSTASDVHSVTLTDTRDNNTYTVSKLADQKCWMTKNLNLPGGTTVTPADSNVTTNYTIPVSSTSGFSDNNTAYVYNGDAADTNYRPEYGGYYSWRAATADTGTTSISTDGENAPSSICPKGWRLPTKDEFDTMISHYSTNTALTSAPVNMKYSGVYYSNGFGHVGTDGYYWSSISYDSTRAYNLGFGTSGYVGSSYGSNRCEGISVRCVYDRTEPVKPFQTYSLSFNANTTETVTNMPDDITSPWTADETYNMTLPTATPTRSDGRTFLGWSNDSGKYNMVHYKPGETISFSSAGTERPLYAVWTQGYMQTFLQEGCDGLPVATTTTGTISLVDSRDNQLYTVAKLADNKCWMTTNLDYAQGRSSTSATYGGYYNWTHAKTSCPSNWHLPSKIEFQALINSYNNGNQSQNYTTFQTAPLNFLRGEINSTFGGYGTYWSSTVDPSVSNYSHNLVINFASSIVYVGGRVQSDALTVRCTYGS